MSSPPEIAVGSVLADRYRLDELLGEGGMGKVYAAEHVLMRKRVAVKVLHRELCDVPELVARFEREAMATANIEHPNIAAATDCGKLPDGSLFLVLELVQGKSLRDAISAGAMPVPRALHIARQIASALAAAHALRIVHRDLKPENVMLVAEGEDPDFVKLLDFGVAKVPSHGTSMRPPAMGAPLTKLGVVFGTPEYMAPEQALGQSVDHRADLYALGVIFYELLSGVRPFTAQSEAGILGQQLAKLPPPFSERAPGVQIPPAVEAVVQKLLAKEAGSRFQSADELVLALDELLLPPPPEADVPSAPLPAGAATALLGTAAEVYGSASAPEAPQAQPVGPGGTLLLDEGRKQELAGRVAQARAGSPGPSSGPTPPPAPPVWKRAGAIAARELGTACELIDDARPRLPEGLRRTLANVPAGALLALFLSLAAMPTALLWVVAAVSGRPGPKAASSARPAVSASESDPVLAELGRAKQEGHAALEKLAERYPEHALVAFELAQSHAARSNHVAAVASLGRALGADGKLSAEPASSELLAAAVRQRDSVSAAFGLLEGPMGAAGATIIYDLSVDQKVQASTRTRAQKWVVQSPDFLKVATPSVEVAAKLRYAKSCSDRHKLLPRVAEVGDQRALAYLKLMKTRGGCGRRGRDDCFPCLRKDDLLEETVAAVEKRVGKSPEASAP